MKRDIKLVATGVVAGAMLVGGIATAALPLVTGEVYNNQFPILLNGNEYTTQMPILNYQERTYVPLRELAELTGSEVDFVDNKIVINNENENIYASEGLTKSDIKYIEKILEINNGNVFNNSKELSSDKYLWTVYEILWRYRGVDVFNKYSGQMLEEVIPDNIEANVVYDQSTIENILKDIYGLENIEHKSLEHLMQYEYNKYYINIDALSGEEYCVAYIDSIYLNENNQYEVLYSVLRGALAGISNADGPFEAVLEKTENGFRIVSNLGF